MSKQLDQRIAQYNELADTLKQAKKLQKKNKSLEKKLAKSERQLRKSRNDRVKKVEKVRALLDDLEDKIVELKDESAKKDEIMATQRHRIEGLCAQINQLKMANEGMSAGYIRNHELEQENAKLRANEARMRQFVENLNIKK